MTAARRSTDGPSDRRNLHIAGRASSYALRSSVRDPVGEGIEIVMSAEPGVVFTSLAEQCAPKVCDECRVDICEGLDQRYRISYPIDSEPAAHDVGNEAGTTEPGGGVLTIDFDSSQHIDILAEGEEIRPHDHFRGAVSFIWRHRPPTPGDSLLVELAVAHAVRSVMLQRFEHAVDSARVKIANLNVALETSRQIGTALGILMSLRKISSDDAFDLLREASQRSQRRLRHVAVDVIETGWLDPDLTADRPGTRSRSG